MSDAVRAGQVDRLQHHFEDLGHQEQAARLGMWLFVSSEALLFAGLFALYAAYRVHYGAGFRLALQHNDPVIGTVNTAILLISSFTIAWSIRALRRVEPRACIGFLLATMALGATFLVLKSVEYGHHIAEGILPGTHYASPALRSDAARVFFTLYYVTTGLHALHMGVGLIVVGWLALRVRAGRTTPSYHVELECGGLYWHLVDSIWIFLWPLYYITG